jgi:hypothetical protein
MGPVEDGSRVEGNWESGSWEVGKLGLLVFFLGAPRDTMGLCAPLTCFTGAVRHWGEGR